MPQPNRGWFGLASYWLNSNISTVIDQSFRDLLAVLSFANKKAILIFKKLKTSRDLVKTDFCQLVIFAMSFH